MTVAPGANLDLAGLDQIVGSLSGAGTVTNSSVSSPATLTAGGDNSSTTFSGIIQDGASAMAFTKIGTGILTFTGSNTYSGATTVDAGALAVNGSIVSPTTVQSGGILMGTGTLGPVSVLGGGIYAPGNSIGTQTLIGNLALGSNAIYEVEVNAGGQGDKVIVAGTVNLTGSVLRVLAEDGDYAAKHELPHHRQRW